LEGAKMVHHGKGWAEYQDEEKEVELVVEVV
jgi:hypothetical protein